MDLSGSSFKLFLSKSGNAFLMFAAIVFFARELGSTDMGIFFLFFALQGLLSIPANLGIRTAMEKRLSEGVDPEDTLASALSIKIVLLAVVSVGVLAFRGQFNEYFGAELAVLLVLAVVLRELALFYIHAVRGELRVGETAPIEFARRFTWVTLGAVLVTQGFGVRGLVSALLAGSFVALVWAYVRCDVAFGSPSVERAKSLFAFSKYDTITSVGGRIYQWMDSALIGFFLAQSFVSAYEVAWQITLLVLMFSKSISLSIFPQISQWSADSSVAQIESTISTAIGFAVFASIPAIVGSAIYATEILHYTFGPEYTIASTVLVILMVEKLFQSFNDIVGISVRAIDRPGLAAKATIVSVGINLVLSPVLIVTIGFVGAAIATTVSWVVNTVLHMKYLSRFVNVDIPYRLVGWYTVGSICMGGALLGVKSVFPVTGVVPLVLQVAAGAAMYFGFSVLVPDVRSQIVVPVAKLLDAQLGLHRMGG